MSRVSLFCVLSLFSINLLAIAGDVGSLKKKPATQDSTKPSATPSTTTTDQQKNKITNSSTSLIINEVPDHQWRQHPAKKRIVCPLSNDSQSLSKTGPGLVFIPVAPDFVSGGGEFAVVYFRFLQVNASMPNDSTLVCNYSKLFGRDSIDAVADQVLQTLAAQSTSYNSIGCRNHPDDCSFIQPSTMTCANSNGCNYSAQCPSSLAYGLDSSVSLPSGWGVGQMNKAPFLSAHVTLNNHDNSAVLVCKYDASPVNHIDLSYNLHPGYKYKCSVSPTGASFDCTVPPHP